MDFRVSDVFAHFVQEFVDIRGVPAEGLDVEAEGEGFEAGFYLDLVPGADCFLKQCQVLDSKAVWCQKKETYEMLILRPRPNRQNIFLMLHPLKPRLLHPPLQLRPRTRIPSKIPTRIQQRPHPLLHREVIFQRAVFGVVGQFEVAEFGPAARFNGGEGLAHEFGPVDYGGGEVAGVDVVEGGGEGPGFFAVVDFEFHVRGTLVAVLVLWVEREASEG